MATFSIKQLPKPDSSLTRSPNLIEVIHTTKIHKYINPLEAERHLSNYPANIRLDLHGVLDVIPNDVQLVTNREINKIVCISFVGDNTREAAVRDIRDRIRIGQIDYGVLVFTRGRGKDRFTFTDEGSKAWVNKYIPSSIPSIFIDDSTDHLRSSKHLIPDMTCTLFNTGIVQQLLDILKKNGTEMRISQEKRNGIGLSTVHFCRRLTQKITYCFTMANV